MECGVKIRYNMRSMPARFTRQEDGTVSIDFENPLRAVAPGQAAVFYGVGPHAGRVLGGGTISGRMKQ